MSLAEKESVPVEELVYDEKTFNMYFRGTSERDYIIGHTIDELLKKWDRGSNVLIPGVGWGRNAVELWFRDFKNHYGVDLNRVALKGNSDGRFVQVRIEALPFNKGTFQYAYISDLLQDFKDREGILIALQSIVKTMKGKGQILLTNPTAESYLVDSTLFDCNQHRFPVNKPAVEKGGGAEVSGVLKGVNFSTGWPVEVRFVDHIWKEKELERMFKDAGLRILIKKKPVAKKIPGHEWISETKTPPWVVYLLEVV